MKQGRTAALLGELERLQFIYDGDSGGRKLGLLQRLGAVSLRSSGEVLRLHELLCFMRAYPDNRQVMTRVMAMLDTFADRRDLRRYRHSLADTGIAGVDIHYCFHWKTAKWLLDHWPGSLRIDWTEFRDAPGLEEVLPLLLPQPALETLEHVYLSPQEWIEKLKVADETDAGYLIRIFSRWPAGEAVREKTWDGLDLPLILIPAPGSPSRTRAWIEPRRPAYGAPVIASGPPDMRAFPQPSSVRAVSPRYGSTLVNLARTQMVSRSRDLYAFMNADAHDVRIVSYDGGLQFVAYGLHPHARSLLESMYVFLMLKNGLPVGYTQAATLFRSAEINFTIFDTFRGSEASRFFCLTLAMVRHMFGCDTFIINTQQLGEDNEDAIRTGAFWFYHKHGFRSRRPEIRKVVDRELGFRKRNPRHRSDRRTLRRLAGDALYLDYGRRRSQLVNNIPAAAVGLAAARILEAAATPEDPRGTHRCISSAAGRLGCRIDSGLTAAQREMWERWSPLVLSLEGLSRWSTENKRKLVDVINAKGGHRESEFVALFDAHRTLQRAIVRLGERAPP